MACHYDDLPVREYGSGEVIIEQGGRSGALFFVKSGKVGVSRDGVCIAEIEEVGSVLGEISVLLDRPHIAEVRALAPTVLHVARDAEAFLRNHPEVNLFIARSLARKVDAMNCYLTDLKHQYADETNHLGMVHEVLDSLMQIRE